MYDKAINIYIENLNLNPNDNQGIRHLLLDSYFAIEDYSNAEKIIRKYYEEECTIEFAYGKLVLEILKDNKKLKALFENAVKANAYLPDLIIKKRNILPPTDENQDYSLGSPEQAYDYWQRNIGLYKNKKIVEFYKTKPEQ